MMTKTLIASEREWETVHSDLRPVTVHPNWLAVDTLLRRYEMAIDQNALIATLTRALGTYPQEAR